MKNVLLILTVYLFGSYPSFGQIKIGNDIVGENSGDLAGQSICMPDEYTIAIGASKNYGNGTNAGHVRVYSWNGSSWIKRGRDIDGELGDFSGEQVCMPDANTVAIGASNNDGNQLRTGIVRIFVWNSTAWVQKGLGIMGKDREDYLGTSLNMPDANTIAVGSNGDKYTKKGYVSVFKWNGATWIQKGNDIIGKANQDESGIVTMPDSNTVAVGAPGNDGNGLNSGSVRIYYWSGIEWVQKGQDINGEDNQDNSGGAICMPDANTIAIGAIFNSEKYDDAGHVRIYSWNGSSWIQKGQDIDGESKWDQFGSALSMPDANTIAIGSLQGGYVNIYSWNGANWVQKCNSIVRQNFWCSLGASVSMPNKNILAVGMPGYGAGGIAWEGIAQIYDVSCNSNKVTLIDNLVSLSPNPVTQEMSVNFNKQQQKLTLAIYNLNGQLLIKEIYQNTQKASMDLSRLKSGVYFLKVSDTENRVLTQKVTKL